MPRESRSYRRRSRSRSRSLSRDRTKRRKKSRSKSIERRRSRSRDRSRRSHSRERRKSSRSKSRDRERRRKKRSRSRSRDRKRDKRVKSSSPDKRKSTSPSTVKVIHREGALHVKDEPLNKEEEQKRLEMEMQKRRERIEQWRTERKKTKELIPINIAPPTRTWTLEDEDDDDEEDSTQDKKDGEDDEVDPLDAYMQSVSDDAKPEKSDISQSLNTNCAAVTTSAPTGGKVTFIMAVAKKKGGPLKDKGELMESNQDAMEYSSEEEEEGIDVTMANIDKMKKKDLVAVDHSRIYYPPFRKDFYVEVPEIAALTVEDVEKLREDLEGIKIRGKNCPKPIKAWSQCGVSKKIHLCLKKYEYEKPTPIQSQAIPVIMAGRDMIGIAKTGSGKTLAFLLPMFRHILDQSPLDEEDGPICVILTPTRELALQIASECKKVAKPLGLQTVCVYGGTGISEQIAELKRGCEIIVCTPGRMIDMLAANNGKFSSS